MKPYLARVPVVTKALVVAVAHMAFQSHLITLVFGNMAFKQAGDFPFLLVSELHEDQILSSRLTGLLNDTRLLKAISILLSKETLTILKKQQVGE